jgi:hypothetical protein
MLTAALIVSDLKGGACAGVVWTGALVGGRAFGRRALRPIKHDRALETCAPFLLAVFAAAAQVIGGAVLVLVHAAGRTRRRRRFGVGAGGSGRGRFAQALAFGAPFESFRCGAGRVCGGVEMVPTAAAVVVAGRAVGSARAGVESDIRQRLTLTAPPPFILSLDSAALGHGKRKYHLTDSTDRKGARQHIHGRHQRHKARHRNGLSHSHFLSFAAALLFERR